MAKRRKWKRRRGDKRVEENSKYALIQDSSPIELDLSAELPITSDDPLAIPAFETEEPENKILAKTSENTKPTAHQDSPRIFAFMGASGGVGTTSVSIQLAHEFAINASKKQTHRKRPKDPTVCLIDLDFESGACAHHLDLLPSLTLEDLCSPADRIDPAFTQSLMSTHESGISLLAAPNTIGANGRVNPHTIMAMLDAAAELYQTVIIDLPRYQQNWSHSVMRAVDVLGLTCELTIPSLHAARERLAQLSETRNEAANAQVILSKFERRSFKNSLRLSDAETALGQSVLATLCLDPDTTREALNCGEPAGVIRPESRFVKDIRQLSTALLNQKTNSLSMVA